ncbi:MAG TPA: DUF1540 domain-containing protein [Firmicutes bacterium]|nr:DUF1540 domain-containing protein [Bacillota bacterium]HHY97784.1 DUF1540 domain-containing protein [Bacillota bacterium]
MAKPKPDVRCSVDTCEYWGSGDVCNAEAIHVQHNSPVGTGGRMEIGEIGEIKASTSEETCCRTFKPKAGGTQRMARKKL